MCAPLFPPKFFHQETEYTCAVACLRMAASAYGISVSESDLAQLCDTSFAGTLVEDLAQAAKTLGLIAHIACDDDPKFLDRNHLDCHAKMIIPYLRYHLIEPKFSVHAVLLRSYGNEVVFWDPAASLNMAPGERTLSRQMFDSAWDPMRYLAVVVTGNRLS